MKNTSWPEEYILVVTTRKSVTYELKQKSELSGYELTGIDYFSKKSRHVPKITLKCLLTSTVFLSPNEDSDFFHNQ